MARIFEGVAAGRAWVPSLWRLEVANGLQAGLRRGRIKAAFRCAALADRFRLTAYDAAYVEPAARLGLPLASLGRVLVAAAEDAGIVVPT